jgi:hypothetical protein
MIVFVVLLGAVFGVLGATMAGLTTYEEYVHHFPGRAPAIRAGIHTALATFLFFIVASAAIGTILNRLLAAH